MMMVMILEQPVSNRNSSISVTSGQLSSETKNELQQSRDGERERESTERR